MSTTTPPNPVPEEKAPRFTVPHTYVIIFSLMLLAGLTTYLLPGGEYKRVERVVNINDKEETKVVVDPDSFREIPSVPQDPWKIINAVMKGLRHHDAMDIIFFILLVGGAFGIITETGAIEGALGSLVKALQNKEQYVIPVVMAAFSLAGATFGMCEETIHFVAMAVPLALRLGYDSITGIAMVYVGAMIGFATAFLNPFTVGIAQGIAQVKPFSGMPYRIGLWVFFTLFTIGWVMRYARRIKAHPEESPVYDLDRTKRAVMTADEQEVSFSLSQKGVLLIIVIGFGAIIFGAIRLGWYIDEMAAIFLTMGILAGLITRLPLNTIAAGFSKGCADIANAAIMVGFARAVLVILTDGQVMDTILHGATDVRLSVRNQFLCPQWFGAGGINHADHGTPGRYRARDQTNGGSGVSVR